MQAVRAGKLGFLYYFWHTASMGRPATGQTPVRSVRVPDGTWNDAKTNAEAEGASISDVIVRLLERYNTSAARKRKASD
jgi:hypothetical protein